MKNSTILKASLAGLLFMFSISVSYAQEVTSTSGYYPSSAEYYESLPVLTITPQSRSLTLPPAVDNSTKPYFPQKDNSNELYVYDQKTTAACQSVATVWNTFTYEINRLRNVTSNLQETRYVPNFSFNHLNHGFADWQGYTSLEKVQKFLKETGGMSDAEFDGPGENDILDLWRWPTGYDLYYNAIKNKLHHVERIDMSLPSGYNGEPTVIARLESNLDAMKHYLYDHGIEDADNGGVITFGVNFETALKSLVYPSAHAGEPVMTNLNYCNPGGHALTIVGYNDSIMYDWGGNYHLEWCEKWQKYDTIPDPDGIICNTCDNNHDGIIDMQDWETGAVKVYNSYGAGNDYYGYKWMMYSTLPFRRPAGLQWWGGHELYTLTPKASFNPAILLKVKIEANKRDDLRFGCGSAPLANYTAPVGSLNYYTGYSFDGGSFPIQGKDKNGNYLNGPLEVMFDYSYFYWNADVGKVFFINENTGTEVGQIKYLALVDYRWNEVFELPYDQSMPFNIGNPTAAGIEYDLIPHETPIADDLTFEANMVSRFNPKVDNNRTLTINNGVRIDMYNSEITVESGSTLLAGNNVTFLGKRGNSRIVIKGEATFGDNLLVKAEDGATIELVFDNYAIISTISNAYFENANITIACPSVSIEGSTFSAKPDNKFIIARGGKLVSDNNLFTAINNTLWRGIELQGNSNVAQIPTANQGILIINRGSIENAECGIRTWKPIDGTNTPDPNYSGGLVIANDANFINNIVAVEFSPYRFPNNGRFTKCNFYTTVALPDGKFPDYFVKLNGVSNISFKGCLFENTYKNEGVSKWGSGIYAYDADVLVDQACVSNTVPCGAYLKSRFKGLYRGIYVLGTTSQRVTRVHNSKFNNTLRGMYVGNADFASVKLNNFEVIATVPGLNPGGYGLYMDASTAFAIEENDFHSAGFTREGKGLVINEAGSDNNEVYNNKFRNLEYGSIAQGYNKQSSGSVDGLCYKCNDFINNGTDIRISPRHIKIVTAMDGIAYHQGANIPANNLAPAGNTFTATSNVKDISNACNWIIYYRHHYGPASLLPNPADLTTNYPVLGTTYTKIVSCPSRIGTGIGTEETRMAMEGAEAQAGGIQANLDAIVDGGSTPELQAEVANSTPDEGLMLRNQLLIGSPYLSDTVIKTSITKEQVLNNAMIRDVLVANPQSAKSAHMVEMLDERMVPMTEEMKNEVLSGQTITSGKENLEATLSSYKHEVWVNFTTLCNLYASDTLHTWQSDTMGVLLAGANTPGTRYQLAFWQLFKGNPIAAQQVISVIPSEFTLDAVEQALHNRYATLLNELVAFENNPEMVLEPGSAIYEALMQLSTSSEDKPAALSRNLLLSAGLTEYEEPIKLDDGLKSMPIYKPLAKATQSQKLKVYPNPANSFVTVSWNAPGKGNTTLMIHDATGRQTLTRQLLGLHNETIVDITGFVHGTYTVSLSQGGRIIATETLVIAR